MRVGQLLPDEHGIALTLDAPAGDRIQRWSAHRLAGSKAEAGVVPRAADRVCDDQSIGERSVIVRAVCADGEQLVAGAREQNVFVADAPRQHAADGERIDRDPLAQVRS